MLRPNVAYKTMSNHGNDNFDVRLGILADSHIPHRIRCMPPRVYDLLAGCHAILHAGDLEDPHILDALREIAPTHAVRGNLHWQYSLGIHDQDLPLDVSLAFNGVQVWLTHGHFHFGYSVIDKMVHYGRRARAIKVNDLLVARLVRKRPTAARVVVFGHSHRRCAEEHDGVLYFNPGAVTGGEYKGAIVAPPSMGFLTISAAGEIGYAWAEL
jgi:hypothetical protein